MTCNLVRLFCKRTYGETGPQQLAPDYRQFDVPSGRIEETIRDWYESRG